MAYSDLSSLFAAIANSIRSKTGETGTIKAEDFPTEITAIQSGKSGKTTGTLKFKQGGTVLTSTVTNSSYLTITHNLGTVPAIILVWRETAGTFDTTSTYNIVCGMTINNAAGLTDGVGASVSAVQCVNSSGTYGGNTILPSTLAVCDTITSTSFRLRTSGTSRCWGKTSSIRWLVFAPESSLVIS